MHTIWETTGNICSHSCNLALSEEKNCPMNLCPVKNIQALAWYEW